MPLNRWPSAESSLLNEYFPDFLLATAFFTALIFGVLSERFNRQRAAAVASLAMGLALSTGLTWWEAGHGYTIRNLGPLAVGFALVLLAAVIYRAIKTLGGSWSGVLLTLGISVLLGWSLGLSLPVNKEIVHVITTVALMAGMLFLVGHHKRNHRFPLPQTQRALPAARKNLRNLYIQRHIGDQLGRRIKRVRRESDFLPKHPELGDDVLRQLQRLLPAEGYLTERLSELRKRAHLMREGHVARIEEIQGVISKLPPEAKATLSAELKSQYGQLSLTLRMERLEKACAKNEQKIRNLTVEAHHAVKIHDHRRLTAILERASKLQKHNSRLFKIIECTEKKLITAAEQAAGRMTGVASV